MFCQITAGGSSAAPKSWRGCANKSRRAGECFGVGEGAG